MILKPGEKARFAHADGRVLSVTNTCASVVDFTPPWGWIPAPEKPPRHKPKTNSLDHEPNLFDSKPKKGVSHKHWRDK